jgi:(E)-4-hydroxy-3-methylbut-2-enyl-diphosphate synthase
VFLAGVSDHVIDDERMLDHIVRLVEDKAAAIEAENAAAAAAVAAE